MICKHIQSVHRIQHTFHISDLFVVSILLLLSVHGMAQQDKVVLNLKQDNAPLVRENQFYIEDVEDRRKSQGRVLGNGIVFGKDTPLFLDKTVEKELLTYWSNAAPRKSQAYLPLYITVKELCLSEKRAAPNRVTGEAKLTVSFRWYRNMEPVELTSFQTTVNFQRTERDYDHSKLITQMLDQSITHFQKWMSSNIGKSPALARNLILTFKEIRGSNDGDTVFYDPKRPLIWNDFQGKSSRPGSRFAAAVFTSFAYEGKSYPQGVDLVVEIGLETFMVKSMSWANENAKNATTIRHEQLHFDVTRMVVDRFRERLIKAELTIEDFDSEIQYQFLEAFREMNYEQEKYDGESSHGLNAAGQAKWDKFVSGEIDRIYSTQ
jgi:hypothetical protein